MEIEFDSTKVDVDILKGRFSHLYQKKFLKKWEPEKEIFQKEIKWLEKASKRIVEIGCGKGRFLIEMAEKNPQIRFLGFEIINKSYKIAKKRAEDKNLKNLLIVRKDAIPIISFNFPDNFVDEYYFLYPDPWPKRRHRKRRWYFHPFFPEILRTLKIGGKITITTDNINYINEAFYLFKNFYHLEILRFSKVPENFKRTHFEEKFLKRGLSLYEIVGKKIKKFPQHKKYKEQLK